MPVQTDQWKPLGTPDDETLESWQPLAPTREDGLFLDRNKNNHNHMGTGTNSTEVHGLLGNRTPTASGARSYAAGYGSVASGSDSIAIGSDLGAGVTFPTASSSAGIAIGSRSTASGNTATIAIGDSSIASGSEGAIALGFVATASGNRSIAIGENGLSSAASAIGLGFQATASGIEAIAFGSATTASSDFSVALGTAASATAASAVAVGDTASAGHASTVALGPNATTTAANQIMMGAATHQVHVPGTLKIPTGASNGYVLTSDATGVASWASSAFGITGFATPAIVLGTAAAAGAATTVIRSDSTIVAFDATVPGGLGTAATGSVAFAARRDHVHASTTASTGKTAFTIPDTTTTSGITIGGDTNMYRVAADNLRTDDAFSIVTAGGVSFGMSVTGDTNYRLDVNSSDGTIRWGTGSAAPDTNLFRSAANQLKTDDQFLVTTTATDAQLRVESGSIVAIGGSGTPGTTHESNNAGVTAQMYGRGFAYSVDSAAHQGGVTAGLSISANRSDPAVSFNNAGGDILQVYAGASLRGKITTAGSHVTQGAALATTATDGFLYIPTSAGAPTGTPTTQTGTVALEYDTTNNDLYVYNGAWKKVALA